MTLDDFQRRCDEMTAKLREDFAALLLEGVTSNLDPQLMAAIFERSISKMGEQS